MRGKKEERILIYYESGKLQLISKKDKKGGEKIKVLLVCEKENRKAVENFIDNI